jgi:CRP-like cAMP-binding protein
MRRSQLRPPTAEAFNAQQELAVALQQRAALDTYSKGTILFREGEPSRGVYLLIEGAARLYLQCDDTRTTTVRHVGPGYLLGLPGTILNRSYLFTAKLTRDSRVAFIPSEELLDFLRHRSDLCFDVVELLGGELIDLPPTVHPRVTRHRRHRMNA